MTNLTMIGAYGAWAADLVGDGPARLSLPRDAWTTVESWREAARRRVWECLAAPDIGGPPQVTVRRRYEYDGLHVEELAWQLPYGPPTEAIFMKPAGSVGPLPGVLALHDHGGLKFFGKERIARTSDAWHPLLRDYAHGAYGGVPWANELAKRGYAVLAPDAFAFGSRRVRVADVPEWIRPALADDDGASTDAIAAYNEWAGWHESVLAKSLLCAGTTWAGVWLAEDLRALDVLCARSDVDPACVGCVGLSGGGLRTVYLAGLDDRIACAVCVGMMTTWRDYLLHKSAQHTWMIYIPHLPRDLDYPEILGLRAPKPALVLNDRDDELFTLAEMQRADDILRAVYARAGAAAHYRCSFYPGPHKFDLPMQAEAFDWLDHWLRNGRGSQTNRD